MNNLFAFLLLSFVLTFVSNNASANDILHKDTIPLMPWRYEKEFKRNYASKFENPSMPLFCRIENRINMNKKIGFKFRLGTLEVVDKMEYPNANRFSPK